MKNHFHHPIIPDISRPVAAVLLFIIVAIALSVRLSGMEERQLAWDEYFFISSVHNILEGGLPRFKSGGYYIRGFPLQYLTAASIKFFGDGYFAYRLPAVLFGTSTVLASYFLGRLFIQRLWSVILAAMVAFSSWEIELSLFARMYSTFQFVAVCFFWSFYRYSFNMQGNEKYLAVAFSILAVLSHALGIFITTFIFLPLLTIYNGSLYKSIVNQKKYLIVCIAVFLCSYFYISFDFRSIGVSGQLPPDFVSPEKAKLNLFLFGTSIFGRFWFFTIGTLAVIFTAVWFILFVKNLPKRLDNEELWMGLFFAFAACCAVFHQFALAFIFISILLLRYTNFTTKRPYLYMTVLIVTAIIFWATALASQFSFSLADGILANVKDFRRAVRQNFFIFPDIYEPFIYTWARTMTMVSLLAFASIGFQIFSIRKMPLVKILQNPAIPIVLVGIYLGLKAPPSYATRYSHFVYPLVLCVALLSASQLSFAIITKCFPSKKFLANCLACATCFAIFTASEDFDVFHLTHADAKPIVYRIGPYEKYSWHWYPRWDYESVAKFIQASASDQDKIILSRNVDTIGFYLHRPYYIYYPPDVRDYKIVSRNHGTTELWSGKPIISTFQDIRKLTEETTTVWIVRYPLWEPLREDPNKIWPQNAIKGVEVFRPGYDSRIEVLKIELQKT